MSRTITQTQTVQQNSTHWREYVALTKPRVVLLLMLTAVVGMHLAPVETVPFTTLILGSLGMAMAMGGAAAVNHVVDQRIDAMMARTQRRPLVQGKISARNALTFAMLLITASMLILYIGVNPLTAILTLFGFAGYALIYTLFLKRATPQNIVIGGVAGALPPLLGWTAVTGQLDAHAFLPVLIIFVWTPPHFWPLAIHRLDDYAKANIPMLPITHGVEYTKTSILHYTLLLCIATMLPFITGMSGLIYLVSAVILNLVFFYYAWRLKYAPFNGVAMKTFAFSIIYLTLLFAALLVDHFQHRTAGLI